MPIVSFPYRYKILDTDYTSYTIKYSCNQVGPLNYRKHPAHILLIMFSNTTLKSKL